ncbi:SGNH/GDSL hydrolase family protein [Pigmentibacter ruber]
MSRSKPKIERLVIFGDSLSDTGRMHNSKTAIIARNFLNQITPSPYGRFTNGYNWTDWLKSYIFRNDLERMLADQIMNEAYKYNYNIEYTEKHIPEIFRDFPILNYSIGGATAVNFKETDVDDYEKENFFDKINKNAINDKITRKFILKNLDDQYNDFLEYSWEKVKKYYASKIRHKMSNEFMKEFWKSLEKDKDNLLGYFLEKDLYIIWIGANDLITVGWDTSIAVNQITLQIQNLIQALIKKGAKNFMVFNLPFFTSSPRFIKADVTKKQKLDTLISEYNDMLMERIKVLKKHYPNVDFITQDINSIMVDLSASNYEYLDIRHNSIFSNENISNIASYGKIFDERFYTRITKFEEGMNVSPELTGSSLGSRLFRKRSNIQVLSEVNINTKRSRLSQLEEKEDVYPHINPYIYDPNVSDEFRKKLKEIEKLKKKEEKNKTYPQKNSALQSTESRNGSISKKNEVYAFHDDVHPGKEIHHLLGLIISKKIRLLYNINSLTDKFEDYTTEKNTRNPRVLKRSNSV